MRAERTIRIAGLTWGLAGLAMLLSLAKLNAAALIVTNNTLVSLGVTTATDGADVGIDHSLTSFPGGSVPSGTVNLQPGITWTNTGDLWIASTFNVFTSSSGLASVNLGVNSTFNNSGNTRIGVNNWSPSFPTGAMDVAAGAVWTNGGQTYVQRGTLTIEGTVNNTNNTSFVGGNQSGSGIVTVQGQNAVWNSTLNISNAPGSAQVNIKEGGTVNSTWGFVATSGTTQTGQVTIDGNSTANLTSTWNASDYISVGEFGGHGTLTVNDHGRANAARMFIGMDGTGVGQVKVNSGGAIDVAPGFFAASVEMWTGSNLDLTSGGKMLIGTGSVVAVTSDTVRVASNGIFKGGGIIHGNVEVFGGTLSPGHSPGAITVDGNLTFAPPGALTIEVAGTGAGQFDTVNIQGALDFGGAQLNLVFLNGYTPTVDQLVNLNLFSSTGGISGTFGSVNVTGLPSDLTADVDLSSLSTGQVSFTAHQTPEPASLALLGLAAGGLALRRRRRS